MRLLIDAQLPRRLASRLVELGHAAIHTLELPAGNRTTDQAISAKADAEGAVVVTKDADFVIHRALRRQPERLLVIATGNIDNDELLRIIEANLPAIESAFTEAAHVELNRVSLTIRE